MTTEERLAQIEKDIAELKKRAGIEMPEESCPYPIGMILEFDDGRDDWFVDRLEEYRAKDMYPFCAKEGGWMKHARLPFKWELVPAAKLVIVFDTGAVFPTTYEWSVGEEDSWWGTVIHVEKRPEGV